MAITKVAYDRLQFKTTSGFDTAANMRYYGYAETMLPNSEEGTGVRILGAFNYDPVAETGVYYKSTVTAGVVAPGVSGGGDLSEIEDFMDDLLPPSGWWFEISDETDFLVWVDALGQ